MQITMRALKKKQFNQQLVWLRLEQRPGLLIANEPMQIRSQADLPKLLYVASSDAR